MSNVVNSIAVFQSFSGPSFMGKVTSLSADSITLTAVLMLLPKQGGTMQIGPVMHATKESEVRISFAANPGILTDKLDADLIAEYDRGIAQAYSSLVGF